MTQVVVDASPRPISNCGCELGSSSISVIGSESSVSFRVNEHDKAIADDISRDSSPSGQEDIDPFGLGEIHSESAGSLLMCVCIRMLMVQRRMPQILQGTAPAHTVPVVSIAGANYE